MNYLCVGGNFNDEGGRYSGYFTKFVNGLQKFDHTLINGGYFEDLENIVNDVDFLTDFDVIVWFANVPNDKPKLINLLKVNHPHCLLVVSKNNINGSYETIDMIGRALNVKANLLVEFTREDSMIYGTLLDPLGNCYVQKEQEIFRLATKTSKRLYELRQFTRCGSKKVGERVDCVAPDEYFEILKGIGEELHGFVHGVNTSRFLGNTSFRCTNGFPSVRVDSKIYVSKRNIDKRNMGSENMVAVNLFSMKGVEYYGDNKPSVDTPIQVELYKRYPNVNYMLHTHAYVENAPFTTGSPVPCGSLEEVDKIWEVMPWEDSVGFAINLKGHGSILFLKEFTEMTSYKLTPKPMPENMYEEI